MACSLASVTKMPVASSALATGIALPQESAPGQVRAARLVGTKRERITNESATEAGGQTSGRAGEIAIRALFCRQLDKRGEMCYSGATQRAEMPTTNRSQHHD